jgi:hypothetical protein
VLGAVSKKDVELQSPHPRVTGLQRMQIEKDKGDQH